MRLRVGSAYQLTGIRQDMWDAGHKTYGTPFQLSGLYLGWLVGHRTWHAFEIWVDGKESGVIFMTSADLEQLEVKPL